MKKRKKTAMEIAIEKAERELDRELNIQTPLIYGSAAIALRRFWGWVYMRRQQIKWTNAQVRACLFLSLNRAEGFGGTRIQRLTEQMDAVQQEYSCNVPEIIKACKEIAGVQLHSALFDGGRI